MNDLVLFLCLSNHRAGDSLAESCGTSCCKTLDVSGPFTIQPGCLDWGDIGVAMIACIFSIITCVFTILMFRYVKRQLDIANKQLDTANKQMEKQKRANEENERNRKLFMKDTKNHVDQIKNQILIDSLASFIEKKHKYIYCFDELLIQLYNHVTYLDQNREKSAKTLKKEQKYYTLVKKCVVDVEYYLGFMKDIIGLIDKNEKETINKMNVIADKLIVIKKRDGVAKGNRDVYRWLKDLEHDNDELLIDINNSYNKINNKIQN